MSLHAAEVVAEIDEIIVILREPRQTAIADAILALQGLAAKVRIEATEFLELGRRVRVEERNTFGFPSDLHTC
jgi:hypothetical protein